MLRRIEPVLIALLGVYLILIAGRHLAGFPGLHGDEAWLADYALNIQAQGLFSPHEMNTYTGPLYGWLVSQAFKFLPADVFGLRLPGLILNLLAAFLMAWHLGRTSGRTSALAWLALLCSSAVFVLKSRVAWEAYALQPLLLTLVVVSADRCLEEEASFPLALGFLAANFLGTLNHFIFLSVPISLFIFACGQLCCQKERASFFWRLTAVNLLMTAVLCLVKPHISDALWQSHKNSISLLTWVWPLACAVLYRQTENLKPRWPKVLTKPFWALSAIGLGLFFFFHWVALIQIWSGVAIFERLASWQPPLMVAIPLYAWAAALLTAFFIFALKKLHDEAAPARERFLVLWPLAYAASFILLRNTNSIRYYVLPDFLLAMALAHALPRTGAFKRASLLIPVLAAAVFLNLCFWRETAAAPYRRPIHFYVGWHLESSIHFEDISPLVAVMKKEGVCPGRIDPADSFTFDPLCFLGKQETADCDQTKTFVPTLCWECQHPPYFKWTVRQDAR